MSNTLGGLFTKIVYDLRDQINTKVSKTFKINNKLLIGDEIILNKNDIGLNNVENTLDINKPVSINVQNALNTKVSKTQTINGYQLTSNITLGKADIGLENVDNTSDTNKPVSTAVQTALDTKVDKTQTICGHDLSSQNLQLNKADIGLDQVDNTSDIDKPISTAVQNSLNTVNSSLDIINTSITGLVTLISTSIPVGTVMMYFNTSPPQNYLICDGSMLLISSYPDLHGIIGGVYNQIATNGLTHFNLPDLRGMFIRGLDQGRGIDTARTLNNTAQQDSTKMPSTPFQTDSQGSHSHTINSAGAHTHVYQRGYDQIGAGIQNYAYNSGHDGGLYQESTQPAGVHTHSMSSAGGHTHTITGGDDETRPKNIATVFIIKAR